MDQKIKEEYSSLSAFNAGTCLSIYLPTHKSGVEINEKQDLIVFKNALQYCARELAATGLEELTIDALLKPGYDLLKHETFWYNLDKGLAVFIAEGFFKTLLLPIEVPEEVHIQKFFHLSPIVSVMTNNEHFFMLVFSKDSTAFYKGNGYGLEKMEVEGLPTGIDDVIRFEEKDERKLFRGGGTAPGAEANFHGHGSGLSDEKEYISQYLKEVDQTLWTEVLANERAPLILCSVEYMVGIYRQVSNYKFIAEEYLQGNYDQLDTNALFEKVQDIVTPLLKAEKKKALQNYYNQVATELTSSMPEKVIPASYFAQISDLFVQENLHLWGTFDQESNKLDIHLEKQAGDECLVNRAMQNTLANGGRVFVLPAEKMPKQSQVAAFLRFKT